MARWFHEPVESFLKCAAGQMPLVARGTHAGGRERNSVAFGPVASTLSTNGRLAMGQEAAESAWKFVQNFQKHDAAFQEKLFNQEFLDLEKVREALTQSGITRLQHFEYLADDTQRNLLGSTIRHPRAFKLQRTSSSMKQAMSFMPNRPKTHELHSSRKLHSLAASRVCLNKLAPFAIFNYPANEQTPSKFDTAAFGSIVIILTAQQSW
eukprot:g22749.t1